MKLLPPHQQMKKRTSEEAGNIGGSSGGGKRLSLSSDDNKRTFVDKVRKRICSFYEEDADVVKECVKAARLYPTLSALKPVDAFQILQNAFPAWKPEVVINVSACLTSKEGASVAYPRRHNSRSFEGAHTYQAKGRLAKGSNFDLSLPSLLDANEAEAISKQEEWKEHLYTFNIEDAMRELLKVFHFDTCNFDYEVTCTLTTVCGPLKPDMVIKLKGFPIDHTSVGALVSLHSGGEYGGRYNNDFSVGQLITYGQEFLNLAGPERDFIVLGITNLIDISWFCLRRDEEDDPVSLLNGFVVVQSVPTSCVRESLCAYLQAEPACLGVRINWKSELPDSWHLISHLGTGRTSNVYHVESDGTSYALKVPRRGHKDLEDDIKYFKKLEDIDGIPRLHMCFNSMLAIEPVGEPFTRENLAKHGTEVSLAGLVEILQSAHGRNIVNRDLRSENIMISKSSKTGNYRLFILDWGFAEEVNVNGNVCGSLYTASDDVLRQYIQERGDLVYTIADDVVSLVRCLFLFFNRSAAFELYKLGKDADAILHFWKERISCNAVWKDAHKAAREINYDTLKKLFTNLQQSCGD